MKKTSELNFKINPRRRFDFKLGFILLALVCGSGCNQSLSVQKWEQKNVRQREVLEVIFNADEAILFNLVDKENYQETVSIPQGKYYQLRGQGLKKTLDLIHQCVVQKSYEEFNRDLSLELLEAPQSLGFKPEFGLQFKKGHTVVHAHISLACHKIKFFRKSVGRPESHFDLGIENTKESVLYIWGQEAEFRELFSNLGLVYAKPARK